MLQDLYIAPALNNVMINRNQKSKVLAIGYDDKGTHNIFIMVSYQKAIQEKISAYERIRRFVSKDLIKNQKI